MEVVFLCEIVHKEEFCDERKGVVEEFLEHADVPVVVSVVGEVVFVLDLDWPRLAVDYIVGVSSDNKVFSELFLCALIVFFWLCLCSCLTLST